MKLSCLSFIALLAGASCFAQNTVVFIPATGEPPKPGAEAVGQALEFVDKSSLRGALEAVNTDKKEMVWRVPGADAPITLPLAQIGLVNFSTAKAEPKGHATVKLVGGDWIAGEVTEMRDGRLQLRLSDGTALAVDRARVEWICFSKTAAPDCYEGPVSMAGWIGQGGWSYRDGAFRSTLPTQIARNFDALPDRVEYSFEFDQGSSVQPAFNVVLHGPDAAKPNTGSPSTTGRISVSGSTLQFWGKRDANNRATPVDLKKIFPEPPPAVAGVPARVATERQKPSSWRILEDRVAGRVVIFANEQKVCDMETQKNKAGENRGAFSFQPIAYSATMDQALRKIRVAPWDGVVPEEGAIEDAPRKTDFVLLADDTTREGAIESITAEEIKIGGESVPRDRVVLLRLAPAAKAPADAPWVARVRLMERGEFFLESLGIRDGQLQARTSFAGEIALPVTALRTLEWPVREPTPLPPTDAVVFENGDLLRGSLEGAGTGKKLKWRTDANAAPVEIDAARLTGVVLTPRPERPAAQPTILTRLNNGDLLSGTFAGLDRQNLLLEHSAAGRVAVPREKVQTIYFGRGGKLPVVDAALEHDVWERGIDFNKNAADLRKLRLANGWPSPNPWAYLDGGFSIKKNVEKNQVSSGNFNLGRIMEDLPDRVDLSFDVFSKQPGQAFFSAYLFTEPNNIGYMVQFHQGGLFLYDTNPQRVQMSSQQLQRKYDEKIPLNVAQRRVRILADRPSGRMTLFVDGVEVGAFGPRPGSQPRNLARGLGLTPMAQFSSGVTFANIWVAPWNGQLPGKGAAAGPAQDSVLLANGDELPGTVGTSNEEGIQVEGEIGGLAVPPSRLSVLEFAGRTPEVSKGVRLRLDDRSVLTVDSYRIENGTVICQSPLVGEIKFPLAALRELVFSASSSPRP